jgi:acylphosphatase
MERAMVEDGRIIIHVVVHGRVQGVGFRAFVTHEALAHGGEGWVRNRRDGAVEAVFAGPHHSVRRLIDRCKAGPPGARVDAVDETPAGDDALKLRRPGDLFSHLPTA